MWGKLWRIVLLTKLFLDACAAATYEKSFKRVILDVDVGTDDAWAILMFLHAEAQGLVKIEAIMCSAGNASIENVCKNVVRLLEAVGRTDIPIYKGSSTTIINKPYVDNHFGKDGFGDVKFETEPDLSIIKPTPAPIAYNLIIKQNPHEISIISLGPLTNVALAIKLYDDVASYAKDILIVGGNEIGAKNQSFNFRSDPEAAKIVLESVNKSRLYMIYDRTCFERGPTLKWLYDVVDKSDDPGVKLITRVEKMVYPPSSGRMWTPCDVYAVLGYLKQGLISIAKKTVSATVKLCPEKERGLMVKNEKNELDVYVITNIDIDSFKEMFKAVVHDFFYVLKTYWRY